MALAGGFHASEHAKAGRSRISEQDMRRMKERCRIRSATAFRSRQASGPRTVAPELESHFL